MYIIKTEYPAGTNEPIGTITEPTVIEEFPGEIREAFLAEFIESQECLDTISMIDTVSEEEEPFAAESYFTEHEIDLLNEMFMESDEWTVNQVAYILDRHTPLTTCKFSEPVLGNSRIWCRNTELYFGNIPGKSLPKNFSCSKGEQR